MRSLHLCTLVVASVVATSSPAHALEICGNGLDDDSDGLQDEGCAPGLTTGVCESPLSCNETGWVSPSLGALHYQLPPDVAPKVPYGPGIGLRRFYTSQSSPGITSPPTYQALGTAVSGVGTVSPAWPAHAANDVALLVVETAGTQPASLSVPAGFALLTSQADSANLNGTILTVYWKRATTASEASPTVGDSGDHQLAQIITFRNVATTGNPWDVTAGDATTGTGTSTWTVPGATTTVPNTLVVAMESTEIAWSVINWTNSDLSGFTERTDVCPARHLCDRLSAS